MEFLEEKIFDREQYDTYIRRIHYDDRDAVMYEKMLHFLFPYIVEERGIEDKALRFPIQDVYKFDDRR